VEPLSERELEVLALVVEGYTNPEIADRLYIALSTVKSHINNIYGKLAVSNRVEAVTRTQELQLLD
jgi:LuxR family maltose regulon positive regulatory protein